MKKRWVYLIAAAITTLALMLLTACGGTDAEDDWDYIEEKGTLVIGLDDTFAPMGFRDKDDKLVGFDIDLAKAMGKELGVKVKFEPIEWDAKEGELKAKNIDCVWNGMSATEDRQKSMTLSNEYLENKIVVMSLDKSINIKDKSELKDYKIGTQADSAALESIQKTDNYDDFKDNVKEYPTYDEAILDMKAGRIDVIAIDEVYALYNNRNKDKLYESDFDFGADYYAIGFRKGDTETADEINDALEDVIEDGTAKKISKKWFGKDLVINQGYDD